MASEVPSLARKELTAIGSIPSARSSLTPRLPKRLDNFPSFPVSKGRCAKVGTRPPKASNI